MLAILTTHPIQYQVPIWRGLARVPGLRFKVLYLSDQGLQSRFDPGFGREVAWDIDLLSGYPHEFIAAKRGQHQDRFDWLSLDKDFARELREAGYTVLWLQGWQVRAYWQAVRQARRAGLRVWLRADTNLRSNRGGVAQRLKWLVLRRFLGAVDRFLVVGSANRDFYRRLGYAERKMVRAPHCVENARFERQADELLQERAALRRAWGIPEDAFCVLWVGKFIAKKRPFDLIEGVQKLRAIASARNLHILWVGSGELGPGIVAACNLRYSSESGLHDTTPDPARPDASFAGFLNQSEIARAYVAADVLVLPSDAKETWGLVVNEAMATGLPCVVSDACGCADDLVAPFRAELRFPMGDTDALAESLAAVLRNPPTRRAVREAVADFDVGSTVAAVAALCAEGA